MKNTDSRMYSGTPCNECGGPTLNFASGSIWCPAEDPHPGGHFVKRVAFERAPKNMADLREKTTGRKPKVAASKPQPIVAPAVASPFGGGMDDFVKSER